MIPKKIHRIWLGGEMPQEFHDFGRRWEELHPTWEVRTWHDDDLQWLRNRDLFDAAETLAGQADIARYEVVRREGGFYIDADFEPLCPLEGALDLDSELVLAEERESIYGNSFFAAPAGSEFLEELIEQLRFSEQADPGRPPNEASGPHFLSRSVHRWLASNELAIELLPRDRLFALSPAQLLAGVKPPPRAIAVHHWAHSWRPDVAVAQPRSLLRSWLYRTARFSKRAFVRSRDRWDALEPSRPKTGPTHSATYIGGGETLVNTVHGFPVLTRADSVDTHGALLATGEFQPTLQDFLAKTLRPWDVVVEIGAGIGLLTVVSARRVGFMGRVFAFEPDPLLRRVLERNVQLNQKFGLRAEVNIFGGPMGGDDATDSQGFESLCKALRDLAEIRLLRFDIGTRPLGDDLTWLAPLLDEGRVRSVLLEVGDVTARPDWSALSRLMGELVDQRGGSLGLIENDGHVRAISLEFAQHVDRLDCLLVDLPRP